MIRLLARFTLSLLSDAVGLAAAAVILDGFSIHGIAFVMAVLIFALSTTLLGPFIAKVALQHASYLMGGIALVTTLVGLILTNIFSDGISIQGFSTWIIATFMVWIFVVLGNIILPLIIFRKTMQKIREDS